MVGTLNQGASLSISSDTPLLSVQHRRGMNGGAFASATFPTANKALFIPFRTSVPMLVKQLYCYNGATASGNVDMGIYASDGTRLVSAGSTAQSGTNNLQVFDITDTLIAPGVYYMAVAMDNTTGTLFRTSTGLKDLAICGNAEMTSAFPLPATATLATLSSSYMPLIGLTGVSVV